ncbi:MAG: hypothetical protein AAGA58_12795, partial [Verrucomicrobiota bacterium]
MSAPAQTAARTSVVSDSPLPIRHSGTKGDDVDLFSCDHRLTLTFFGSVLRHSLFFSLLIFLQLAATSAVHAQLGFEPSAGLQLGPGFPVTTQEGWTSEVHLDGNQAIAVRTNGGTLETSVHVFTFENGIWAEEANLSELIPDDGARNPSPDSPANISGDLALVGAFKGQGILVVRAFRRVNGTWEFVQNLTPIAGDFGEFGSSLDLEGETAVICSPAFSLGSTGFVYTFNWVNNAWNFDARFGGYSTVFRFGNDVDLDGDRFVVGARRHSGFSTSNASEASVYL